MTGLADLPPRIQAKIRVDDAGCWIWTGASYLGYGYVSVSGIKTRRAHRTIYELLRAPVPADMVCDHLCRVKLCVNPDHIDVVTQGVNVCRGDLGTLVGKTECPQGHPLAENLREAPRANGRGIQRYCAECTRQRRFRRLARQAAA